MTVPSTETPPDRQLQRLAARHNDDAELYRENVDGTTRRIASMRPRVARRTVIMPLLSS